MQRTFLFVKPFKATFMHINLSTCTIAVNANPLHTFLTLSKVTGAGIFYVAICTEVGMCKTYARAKRIKKKGSHLLMLRIAISAAIVSAELLQAHDTL